MHSKVCEAIGNPAAPLGCPFSIVVVTWNSRDELAGLLETFSDHLRTTFELVVVDNASTDGSAKVARGWSGPRKVITLRSNSGFGTANNVGVRESSHDTIILLNPDTRLIDDSLKELAVYAAQSGALCGPALLNEDGTRQPSASPLPDSWASRFDAVFPAALAPPWLRFRCEPWRASSSVEVGWLTGACIAASKDVLLGLGPFDETIHLYAEDMDLGLRARADGVRSLFLPDVARLVHVGDGSARQRFEDAGLSLKLQNRRTVVRRHLGATRERYDFLAQVVFHTTRYAGKTALGRDSRPERAWLRAARLAGQEEDLFAAGRISQRATVGEKGPRAKP